MAIRFSCLSLQSALTDNLSVMAPLYLSHLISVYTDNRKRNIAAYKYVLVLFSC